MTLIEWQRQLADRTVVLLRPRRAHLHENQLIPRGNALHASPDALPASPLFREVRALGQLSFASAADHRRLNARSDVQGEPAVSLVSSGVFEVSARSTPGLHKRDIRPFFDRLLSPVSASPSVSGLISRRYEDICSCLLWNSGWDLSARPHLGSSQRSISRSIQL